MSNYMERSTALVEALPYIQTYYGKTVIIKYGGNAMISEELRRAVISDIILLNLVGVRVVMVHGGGPEIGHMLKLIGKESKFVDGLRYTDEETMDIVQQVLCGKVNKGLVSTINNLGGKAIGLCGLDGALFQAKKLDEKYGLVGKIVKVCPQVVTDCLAAGYIPVVSTVALGIDNDTAYNINADTAAAELAVALGAEKLILLTDVRGVLQDPKDESTLIRQIRLAEVPNLIGSGIISGGMIPKIDCCVNALEHGVQRTHILDGRIPHSILTEMLSHKGVGTMIWA
ncbi:MAG: acetylglutamate kinase [Ruminiclostridium sp.]|nr:acetylglutamate kinase [Ruminiclostridium sp.]MCI9467654.1 acetylglutamate kinase [Ruminiclostridium sp.]